MAVISLTGGSIPFPTGAAQEPRVLVADAMVGQSMTQAARLTLRHLDGILGENAESLRGLIGNLNTFSAALARNSGRIDGIVGGLERMTGGPAEKPTPIIYDLTAPRDLPGIRKPPHGQIVVPELTAVLAFDTQRILVRPNSKEPSFVDAQWSDSLLKLVQAKVIQSFENADVAASRPTEGLGGDTPAADRPCVRSTCRSATTPWRVSSSRRRFWRSRERLSTPASSGPPHLSTTLEAASAAAALNEAFGKAAVELVVWVSSAT